jgi:hypothetical protein
MKVSELIEILKQQPPDMRVIVDGYEGGYSDVRNIRQTPIKLNVHTSWYYGPHDRCQDNEEGETALLLPR